MHAATTPSEVKYTTHVLLNVLTTKINPASIFIQTILYCMSTMLYIYQMISFQPDPSYNSHAVFIWFVLQYRSMLPGTI